MAIAEKVQLVLDSNEATDMVIYYGKKFKWMYNHDKKVLAKLEVDAVSTNFNEIDSEIRQPLVRFRNMIQLLCDTIEADAELIELLRQF